MSDTPETDAVAVKNIYGVASEVEVDFARKLERERDEARELADSYRIAFCSANGIDKTPNPFPWEATK
jgi:hypothetical protein